MPKSKVGKEAEISEAWRKKYGIPSPEEEKGTYGWGVTPTGESIKPPSSGEYEAGWERAQKKLEEILSRSQVQPTEAKAPEAKRRALEALLPAQPVQSTPESISPEESAYMQLRGRMKPGYALSPEDEEIMRRYNEMQMKLRGNSGR